MAKLKLSNNTDIDLAERGVISPDQVRRVEIDAMVDTGCTLLALPADVVARLGTPVAGTKVMLDARGQRVDVPWVAGLRIEVFGRWMTGDALVLPEGARPLLGQLQLEELDLVVDARAQDVHVRHPEGPILTL